MREYFIWLAKILTIFVIIFLVIPLLLSSAVLLTQMAGGKDLLHSKNKVAVIELTGIIESSKDTLRDLYEQIDDDQIKGVVLRVDSPGGAVGPSQDIYQAVRKLKSRKPIVVSMGSLAASGGLYASLGASKVYSQPGTLTGSIGVILQIPNVRKITEKVGLEMITIKSGQLKDVGNSFRDMTDSERQFLEQTVGKAHNDFIEAIVDGRGINREVVTGFADGRVILGTDAKKLKLVDEFGDVYDAARAIFEILGQPLAPDITPDLYYPGDRLGEFRKLLSSALSFSRQFEGRFELRYELS